MKPVKQFILGSQAFFEGLEGFVPKDKDVLCIMDVWTLNMTNNMRVHLKGDDVIFSRDMTKEEWIKDTLDRGVPMRAGKFLVPSFTEYIKFTIEDLPKLKTLFDEMDEKHRYEQIIYNAYLENGKFELTEEQKIKAYQEYKKYR